MQKSVIVFMVMTILTLASCSSGSDKATEDAIEDTEIKAVKIQRYEKALFALNPDSLGQGLRRLAKHFTVFLDADLHDTLNIIQLHDFITSPLNQKLYDSVLRQYPDLSVYEKEFTRAFQRFSYFFPEKELPAVYTYVSGLVFENPVQFFTNNMIIALDMYLGEQMNDYRKIGFTRYMVKTMNKDYIVRDGIYELYYYHFLEKPGKDVLAKMINKGKHLYFLDALLPETPDHTKIGYPREKLDWCQDNESRIWAFFIENELLYASDAYTLRKFFTDGPYTSDFSDKSPARIGEWLGWQIVRAFMANNPEVTPEMLLKTEDPHLILSKSKYKPKK